jgi:hypothetical protein
MGGVESETVEDIGHEGLTLSLDGRRQVGEFLRLAEPGTGTVDQQATELGELRSQ